MPKEMQISKCSHKQKCDFYGCQNLATYCFSTKRLIKKDLCFCDECLIGMYECIAKTIIPKGTTSPFKLNKRLKKDEK